MRKTVKATNKINFYFPFVSNSIVLVDFGKKMTHFHWNAYNSQLGLPRLNETVVYILRFFFLFITGNFDS